MAARALRLIALAVCVAALALGGFAVARATAGDQGREPPQSLPAARPAPPAPKLPPAVGIPRLKFDEPGQTFAP